MLHRYHLRECGCRPKRSMNMGRKATTGTGSLLSQRDSRARTPALPFYSFEPSWQTVCQRRRPQSGRDESRCCPLLPPRHCRLDEPGHGADNDLIKSDHPKRQERSMAHLLLIDDDPDLLPDQVGHVFPAPAHRVEIARTGTEGLQRVANARPDVILLDLRLPDQSGLEVLKQLRHIDARIPVVLVTVVRSADSAIEAMRQGAYDYLLKPLDMQKLDRVVGEALKVARLIREPAVVMGTPPDDAQPGEAIVGSCPAMQEVYKAIGRVADQTFPVLITGESGTGKELVARAIYQHGPGAKATFLALNCAAIPEPLLESELFGHEKGAFTGAERRRIGKFEQITHRRHAVPRRG